MQYRLWPTTIIVWSSASQNNVLFFIVTHIKKIKDDSGVHVISSLSSHLHQPATSSFFRPWPFEHKNTRKQSECDTVHLNHEAKKLLLALRDEIGPHHLCFVTVNDSVTLAWRSRGELTVKRAWPAVGTNLFDSMSSMRRGSKAPDMSAGCRCFLLKCNSWGVVDVFVLFSFSRSASRQRRVTWRNGRRRAGCVTSANPRRRS